MALPLPQSTAQPGAALSPEPSPPRRRSGDRRGRFFDNTKLILLGIAALVATVFTIGGMTWPSNSSGRRC